MENKRRRQVFYEVGSGKMALEAQSMFEDIQQLAMQSKQPISMSIKIAVFPPPEGDHFGKTQYSLTHSSPVNKSIQYTTEYEGGVAITDGDSVESLLQGNLFSTPAIPEGEK